jgi:hypothetical protein
MIGNMSDESNEQPLISRTGFIIDAILSIAFFLFMTYVLMPHVPSEDPTTVKIVAGMTSFCMTGVFWLAANMFRVTYVDFQRTRKDN